ncbi:MAG: PQQ-binding-like beta-propeller repeat protein [Gemmataceae bacterium]
MVKRCSSLALLFVLGGALRAEDVPQFRGAGSRGVSTEKSLPVNFSDKENLRFKVSLPGRGLSNPVVAGGRIFVTACSGYQEKRLHVLCFDARDGKRLWERSFAATSPTLCHPKTNMAAPTPVTDGENIYALFATNDLFCLDKDGALKWYRSFVTDYPTVGNYVGMAASPTLWKDLLIVDIVNNGESFAAGIDTKTGENRWRIDRPRDINWVTPIVIRNGKADEVILQGASGLFALDPASGKERWSLTSKKFQPMPSPTFGDGVIFSPAERFLAIRPGTAGAKAEIAWESPKLPTGYSSPIYHEGKVYALSARGILNCADAISGKALWDLRLEGAYAASPLLADGRIYVVSEEGQASVIDLAPEPKVAAANALRDTILASPVASDGALLLRSDKYLYSFGKTK